MRCWKPLSIAVFLCLGTFLVSVEAKIPYSNMALAIRRGNIEEVKRLLDSGSPVNEPSGKYRETPLMVAARRGTLEMINLLLERGADVNASAPYAGTALHAAAYRGRLDICQVLIDRGADVNAPNDEGWTVLHQVVNGAPDYKRIQGQFLEIAKLLVQKGANINAATRGGLTVFDMLKTRSTGERERILDFLRVQGGKR